MNTLKLRNVLDVEVICAIGQSSKEIGYRISLWYTIPNKRLLYISNIKKYKYILIWPTFYNTINPEVFYKQSLDTTNQKCIFSTPKLTAIQNFLLCIENTQKILYNITINTTSLIPINNTTILDKILRLNIESTNPCILLYSNGTLYTLQDTNNIQHTITPSYNIYSQELLELLQRYIQRYTDSSKNQLSHISSTINIKSLIQQIIHIYQLNTHIDDSSLQSSQTGNSNCAAGTTTIIVDTDNSTCNTANIAENNIVNSAANSATNSAANNTINTVKYLPIQQKLYTLRYNRDMAIKYIIQRCKKQKNDLIYIQRLENTLKYTIEQEFLHINTRLFIMKICIQRREDALLQYLIHILPIKHLSLIESKSLLLNISTNTFIYKDSNPLWTINGVALFTDTTLIQLVLNNTMEMEHLTIALTYTCKIVLLISKYLHIKLSNTIFFSGKYFCIYDDTFTSLSFNYNGTNLYDFFQAIKYLEITVKNLFITFLHRRRYPMRTTSHLLESLFMLLNHDVCFR